MHTICVAAGTAVDTIGKAIRLLPPDDGTEVAIRLAPGVYREKLTLARPNTALVGAGSDRTAIQWGDAAMEILPDGMKRGTFRTATLMIDAPRVTLRGLTVSNTAAPRETAGQAIALYVDGDRFLAEDCALLGNQDTLFTAPLPPKEIEKNGFVGPKQFAPRTPQRHLYRRCLIQGDIDFIFGGAAAWFEDCEIRSVDGRSDRSLPYEGYATAASTPEGQAFGYVFHRCRFTGDDVPEKSVYLARPWRDFAQTVLLNCELGAHIRPEGFHDWGKTHAHATLLDAEFGSFGPGSAGQRAAFARQLTPKEAEKYTYEALLASMEDEASR